MDYEKDHKSEINLLSINCEEEFKQLISNFFDILVLIDESGYQHYVSGSCEKILGYKPEELLGVSVIDEFIHPDDQEMTKEGLRDIIEHAKNGGTQYRHRHKNGGWVYLEAFGTNQINNPSVQSVVLNVRDITERRKTENELRKSRKRLKELNSTKDRFFSILGHDLKNPISNILGLSDLMLEELKNGDSDSIEDYTRMINHSSKRAIDLLSNLLTWSRSQTGSIAYKPETVNLKKLVDDTVDLLQDSATRKSIRLEDRVSDGIELIADPVMIELIIRNLISNGIKFTPDGGSVQIGAKEKTDKTVIFVKDSGVGISKEAKKKLFQPEYNYSTKGTQKEVGTGLGLLLCKEFVDMHDGKIRVDSEEGEGSTFSFTIPRS